MIRFLNGMIVCIVALVAAPLALGQEDLSGAKDYPGVSRMPGYYIADYEEMSFDSYTFNVMEGGKPKQQAVEGRKCKYRYNLKDNAKMPSALQIVRNYQNAARTAGRKVLLDTPEETTIRLGQGGKEVWLSVSTSNVPSGMFIAMVVIERQAMQQEVTLDAKAMSQDIGATGRVAIYGILFDTGKSELKPESAPALVEIAKLLKDSPALKVYVVGHTDMMADLTTVVRLSQARAQSVVNALVSQHGIADARSVQQNGGGPGKEPAGRAR